LLLTQLALFRLHAHLDMYLQVLGGIDLDPELFHPWHRTYLWVSTVQWTIGVGFLLLTVLAWRGEDRRPAALAEPALGA
jgi:hypothetical protein